MSQYEKVIRNLKFNGRTLPMTQGAAKFWAMWQMKPCHIIDIRWDIDDVGMCQVEAERHKEKCRRTSKRRYNRQRGKAIPRD
jgi:hypothetical protein